MIKETAPSRSRGWVPGTHLSGVLRKYSLPVASSLLLIVTAACDRSALEPDAHDLWPADANMLLNSTDLALAQGDTFRLVTTVAQGNGTVLGRSGNGGGGGGGARGVPRVVWKSSNSSIARVDNNGLVEAVGEGEAVISVASGSLSTFSKATINGRGYGKGGKPGSEGTEAAPEPTPTRIVVSPEASTITAIGGSVQLSGVVYDQNQTPISSPNITWSSVNPEVVSVDGNGKVVARAVGAAIVIATSAGLADTASLEVKQVAASVAVSPSTKSLAVGDTVHLTASAKDANGYTISNATFSWSSSNAGVVSVTSAGVAKALATGSVTITATASGTQLKATSAISATATSTAPTGPTTVINPGEDIQAKVSASPLGTVFTLKSGVHRLQRVQPKDGQQFIGETGAVMNGAKLLTQFTREGSYYVVSGQKAVASPHGSCTPERPRCGHPEDLFLDDQPLIHVSSLSQVATGKWYFDYGAGKVYMADNPSGRKVELGATGVAFFGSAANVVIRGLTIEKYANRAQAGAIDGSTSRGWTVENNVIRYNHGVGVRIGNDMKLRNNRLLRNGQMGVGGIGNNVLVEGNEIAYNNAAGYNWGWEGGGTKFVRTVDLVVRNNHSHHNAGPGIWSDIENIYTIYEGNLVEDNSGPGIFHEISYDGVIRNNRVYRNARGVSTKLPNAGAAGIFVSSSGCPVNPPANYRHRVGDDGRKVCVEVYGNEVLDNDGAISAVPGFGDRGDGTYGQYQTTGLYVHDNTVGGWRVSMQGLTGRSGSLYFEPQANNRYNRNTYVNVDPSLQLWSWDGGGRDWSRWRGYGQDPNSTLR